MPVAERRSSPLFKLLETGLIVAFPQYEASLPQENLIGKKVYLIHLDTPLKHAKHYLGFSEDIQERVRQHRNGRGAAFMRTIAKEGISWHVSRIWDGDRDLERILKNQHNASHLCPTCIQERVYKKTLSIEVDPTTQEKRTLHRERRIQLSLWE